MLGVYGLNYQYGQRSALQEVSFELDRHEILGLLGPNGAGKSTLLKLIAGLLPFASSSQSGQILYQKRDVFSYSAAERASRIAYVSPELRSEFPLSVYDTVLMGRICHGATSLRKMTAEDRDVAHAAMERCFCWGLREREIGTLSGGERSRVALARALAQQSSVLLLDESLSKMDLNHQVLIGRLLQKLAIDEGYSIILVSHDLNLTTEWADRSLLLSAGRCVAYGLTREVITTERIRSLYGGADLWVGPHPQNGTPKVYFGNGFPITRKVK